ncbi:MAG TPA: sigma-54 dependent transcriptional regulator [Bryobacterales bacterium]|nr:sigma-54 dependent transcriptional regulator [Bryobacterales bacterium]
MNSQQFTLLLVTEAEGGLALLESLTAGRFIARAAAPAEVEASLREWDVDAVLFFTERSREDLPRLVKHWKSLRPRAQFYLFLDEAPPTRALVALMHAGFQDVLDRAAGLDLGAVLESIEERIRFVRVRQLERLRAKQSIQYTGLVGEAPEMVNTYDEMLRAARLNCPVLVLGETGTGKGLVAHAIHALSQRSGKPFVTVDCACLAPTLIESELYGVARGAFTGATSDRSGLVEAAQEGTLFLDEVGELPLGMQPKLLRLLEEGEVRRLGSHRAKAVDVRVISATSRELERLIAVDQFRLDLYYRLNVLSIEIAPLRRRRQDIPLLARHFAARHIVQGEPVTVSDAALQMLAEYSWPGNVRELKNCIEAAIASAGGRLVQPQNLPRRYVRAAPAGSEEAALESVNLKRMERRAIRRALEMTAHDKLRAARLLGIGKTTLYRKLKEMQQEGDAEPASPGGYLM